MAKKNSVKKKSVEKYIQKRDKKKLCPKCNGKVFNATRDCKLNYNNQICGHKFISLRQIKLLNESIKAVNISKKTIPKINNNHVKIISNNLINLNDDIIILNTLAIKYDIGCIFPYKNKIKQCIISNDKIIKKLEF